MISGTGLVWKLRSVRTVVKPNDRSDSVRYVEGVACGMKQISPSA